MNNLSPSVVLKGGVLLVGPGLVVLSLGGVAWLEYTDRDPLPGLLLAGSLTALVLYVLSAVVLDLLEQHCKALRELRRLHALVDRTVGDDDRSSWVSALYKVECHHCGMSEST